MEVAAAKLIGAGIAAVALGGAGIGLGIFFGHYMDAAMRNPEAQNKVNASV
jgi:F-type H+-transporting ATPase subunit c